MRIVDFAEGLVGLLDGGGDAVLAVVAVGRDLAEIAFHKRADARARVPNTHREEIDLTHNRRLFQRTNTHAPLGGGHRGAEWMITRVVIRCCSSK